MSPRIVTRMTFVLTCALLACHCPPPLLPPCFESDRQTFDARGTPSDGRHIAYHMTEGRKGSLLVRSPCKLFVAEIVIPTGFSLAVSRELLAHDHMHGGNDLCITLVSEFVLDAPTAPIDERSFAAAEAQQEPLPLHEHLMPWTPEQFFLGSPSRFGHMGGGSARRMAVTDQAGPKTFKQDGKKRDMNTARSNVDEKMSVDE